MSPRMCLYELERPGVPIAERRTAMLDCQRQHLFKWLFLGNKQRKEIAHGVERVRVPIAERRTPRLERLAQQRLRLVELALGIQHHPLIVNGGERVLKRVLIAERRNHRFERRLCPWLWLLCELLQVGWLQGHCAPILQPHSIPPALTVPASASPSQCQCQSQPVPD